MGRQAIFPDTDEGTLLFSRALQGWADSGRSIEAFFGAEYGITEGTVHNTAKRLGIRIPSNRRHDRRAVVDEQRADSRPVEIILARYNINIVTLRRWAHAQGKRLRGNTKTQRAAWWKRYFDGFDLSTAFDQLHADGIPPHVGIAAYHAHVASPDQSILWDRSEYPPMASVMDKEWFADAVQITEAVPPAEAPMLLGMGSVLHYVRWSEFVPPDEDDQPDPDVIRLAGATVRPGDHVTLVDKHQHHHGVEYLGLQHNGLARTRDLATDTRRVTATAALHPIEEGEPYAPTA